MRWAAQRAYTPRLAINSNDTMPQVRAAELERGGKVLCALTFAHLASRVTYFSGTLQRGPASNRSEVQRQTAARFGVNLQRN